MYMGQSVAASGGRGDLAVRMMFDGLDGTAIFESWGLGMLALRGGSEGGVRDMLRRVLGA